VKESLTFTGEDSPMANLSRWGHCKFERKTTRRHCSGKAKDFIKENKLTISLEQIHELRKRIQATETKTQIAKDLNISRYSLYQYLKRVYLNEDNPQKSMGTE
jgi:DNA-binding phage protein